MNLEGQDSKKAITLIRLLKIRIFPLRFPKRTKLIMKLTEKPIMNGLMNTGPPIFFDQNGPYLEGTNQDE